MIASGLVATFTLCPLQVQRLVSHVAIEMHSDLATTTVSIEMR